MEKEKFASKAVQPVKEVAAAQGNEQRISSLEIAEVTGKLHKVVLKAIREMEPAWERECGHKFVLTSQSVEMPQGGVRLTPVFSLTKTECLYVATKFNDAARARLVIRWEELEKERLTAAHRKPMPHLLETEEEVLRRSDAIRHQQIGDENAGTCLCMTASEVAKTLDMDVNTLNMLLVAAGVQYWRGGRYRLTPKYRGRGLAKDRAFHYYSLDGEKRERFYLVWTVEGTDFIHSLINQ